MRGIFFLSTLLFLNFAKATDLSALNKDNQVLAGILDASPITFSADGKIIYDMNYYNKNGNTFTSKTKYGNGTPTSGLTIGTEKNPDSEYLELRKQSSTMAFKDDTTRVSKVLAVHNDTRSDVTHAALTKFNESGAIEQVILCDSESDPKSSVCVKADAVICGKLKAADKNLKEKFHDSKKLKDRVEECTQVMNSLAQLSPNVEASDLAVISNSSLVLHKPGPSSAPHFGDEKIFMKMRDVCDDIEFSPPVAKAPTSDQGTPKVVPVKSGQ